MQEICNKFVKSMFPSLVTCEQNNHHYYLSVPFEESPNLCLIKGKGTQDSQYRFCEPCQKLEGILYDWQMGIQILPGTERPAVVVATELPKVLHTQPNYYSVSMTHAWTDIHDGKQLVSTTSMEGAALSYSPKYAGISVRVFKYGNHVYMLTDEGTCSKKTPFDPMDCTESVWDAYCRSTKSTPEALFAESCPHGGFLFDFVIGGKQHISDEGRALVDSYVVLRAQSATSFSVNQNVPKESVGVVGPFKFEVDQLATPLASYPGIVTPYISTESWAQKVFVNGLKPDNYRFTYCGMSILVEISTCTGNKRSILFQHPNQSVKKALVGSSSSFDRLKRAHFVLDNPDNVLPPVYSVNTFPRLSYTASLKAINEMRFYPTGRQNGIIYLEDGGYMQDMRLRNYLWLLHIEDNCLILKYLVARQAKSKTLAEIVKHLQNSVALQIKVEAKAKGLSEEAYKLVRACVAKLDEDLSLLRAYQLSLGPASAETPVFRRNCELLDMEVRYLKPVTRNQTLLTFLKNVIQAEKGTQTPLQVLARQSKISPVPETEVSSPGAYRVLRKGYMEPGGKEKRAVQCQAKKPPNELKPINSLKTKNRSKKFVSKLGTCINGGGDMNHKGKLFTVQEIESDISAETWEDEYDYDYDCAHAAGAGAGAVADGRPLAHWKTIEVEPVDCKLKNMASPQSDITEAEGSCSSQCKSSEKMSYARAVSTCVKDESDLPGEPNTNLPTTHLEDLVDTFPDDSERGDHSIKVKVAVLSPRHAGDQPCSTQPSLGVDSSLGAVVGLSVSSHKIADLPDLSISSDPPRADQTVGGMENGGEEVKHEEDKVSVHMP